MTMSKEIVKSPAFLSAIETGRNKVPLDLISDIEDFFSSLDYPVATMRLKEKAMVANEVAPLDGLNLQHQMLVAGFANSDLNQKQLELFAKLLADIQVTSIQGEK